MGKRKYKFTFAPGKKGLRKILGDLETDIMEIVWAKGEITVRQAYDKLKEQREIAYTTVMTVMSRLAEKGLLKKIKEGPAFLYRATSSREAFTQATVKKIITGLLADFAAPAISQFVESLGDEKPEKMEELARLVKAKRKQNPDSSS
jgi:predicted transcriptional regulator